MASVLFTVWKDVGYTEGCLERPPKTSSLPASYAYQGVICPSRSELFSRARVEADYVDLVDCSYVRATIQTSGGNQTYYGWIDSVTCASDNPDNPMTIIDWHIDYWRTYLSQASFKGGMVRRRPKLSTDVLPPQEYPYRYRTAGGLVSLNASTYWWVILTFNYTSKTSEGTTYSQIVTACFPVNTASPNTSMSCGAYTAPSLAQVTTGAWDEVLGLNPDNIYSVFLSPVAPNVYSGGSLSGWSAFPMKDTKGLFIGGYTSIANYNSSLASPIKSDDKTTYVVLDFEGNVVGELPWGMEVQKYTYRLIIDTTAAYVEVRFDGFKSHSEGLCFTVPLIPVGLSANGWSSYVYSGARQADIDQARLSASQALETAERTATRTGSLINQLTGTTAGNTVSAVLGWGRTAQAGEEYNVAVAYNDRFQEVNDYVAARQANGLIMSGTGFDALRNGNPYVMLAALKKDDYSSAQMDSDIAMYGAKVSEPTESCQSLIDAGGPLQITNLTVTGSIPPQAKNHFRNAFAGGVRIV